MILLEKGDAASSFFREIERAHFLFSLLFLSKTGSFSGYPRFCSHCSHEDPLLIDLPESSFGKSEKARFYDCSGDSSSYER